MFEIVYFVVFIVICAIVAAIVFVMLSIVAERRAERQYSDNPGGFFAKEKQDTDKYDIPALLAKMSEKKGEEGDIVKEYARRAETSNSEWIEVPEGEKTLEFLERETKTEEESK